MEKIKLIDLTTLRYASKPNKGKLVNRCKNCIFFARDCEGNCAMNAPNTVLTKDEKEALLAHCSGENRYYKCVSGADDDIIINEDKYYLVKSLVNSYNEFSCAGCAFLNRGDCKLLAYENQDKISKSTYKKCRGNKVNYIWIAASKVDLVKPQDIGKESIIKFNEEMKEVRDKDLYSHSSTGVVYSKSVSTPKEPKVSNDNTRKLIKDLNLEEARKWYNSMNPILKDLVLTVYSEAELEDVRMCTALIDIKTAKRLYRNAENVVRQFVLSAFTENELKD